MNYKIRQEQAADHAQVYALLRRAFLNAEHTDGDEHDLVERLRQGPSFVPQLSLVAEQDGTIIGHILFTEAQIGNTTQLVLAPLSVAPEHQGAGVGGKLIVEGHRIARELGYEFSVLVGYPSYYARFGYVDADRFGITTNMELPAHVFMAVNLQGLDTRLNDQIRFAPEFGIK